MNRWKLLALAVGASAQLGGCLPIQRAVKSPTVAAVETYIAQCAPAGRMGLSPRGYAVAGFAFVDQECDGFFDNLALLGQETGFLHPSSSPPSHL